MTEEEPADGPASPEADSPQPAEDFPPAPEPTATLAPPTAAAVGPLSPLDGPAIVAPPADYSATGIPSLGFVRDKIEGRYARSLGSTELAESTPEARSFEEQAAKREEAAQEKLAAIRRSLRDGSTS